MKVLLFSGHEAAYPTEEMQKILDRLEFPYNRIGEIVDYIEKNSEEIVDYSAYSLLNTKKNIGKVRLSSNIYACCTKKKESELFGSNYPITTLAIVDVDITRPWTINIYDGKEYIQYLDYDVVNEVINYCKWKDE